MEAENPVKINEANNRSSSQCHGLFLSDFEMIWGTAVWQILTYSLIFKNNEMVNMWF